GGGRPCVRNRDLSPGPRRTRPVVPPRMASRARVANRRSPHPRHRAASARARRGARGDAGSGVTPMTVRGPDRDGRNLDPYAAIDVSQDPGRPDFTIEGAPGAIL